MSWNEILGQDFAVQLLQAHLAAKTVPGAVLLAGPEGVGKRRLALELAKALNCAASASPPCDRCASCTQMARGTHPDLHVVVSSGVSDQIKIDDIRHLISRVALRPFSARVQVAIIDEAERLTEEAANSLLKVLEEPPATTRFVLLTSCVSDCLPTIVSRCQLLRCQPLPPELIRTILVETQRCEAATAESIASLAKGSAAEAIRLANRWPSHQQVLERLGSENTSAWFEQSLPETREDVLALLDDMVAWLRDLAVVATDPSAPIVHRSHEEPLRRQALRVDLDQCFETVFELVALRDSMEQFVSPRLVAALAREKWLSLTAV